MTHLALMFLFFLGHGAVFTTMSPFLLSKFGSDSNLIFLAGQISHPVGYFLTGYISDRTRTIRTHLVAGLALYGIVQLALFSATSVLEASAWYAAMRLLVGVNIQLSTIAVLEGRGTANFPRIRTGGTVGFFLIQGLLYLYEESAKNGFVAAHFPRTDHAPVIAWLSFALLILAAASATLIQPNRQSHDEYYVADVVRLLKKPRVILFFVLSFAFYFSYQLVDFYLGSFLDKSGGMSSVYAGWCIAVIVEIPFMPLTARIVERWGIRSLIFISTIFGMVRYGWISMAILGYPVPNAIFSQLLHGIHYTGFYIGSVYWLRAIFPDHLYGTGNGAYNVLAAALGGISGNLVFGWILFHGHGATYAGISTAHYLPLFGSAAAIQLLILIAFLFFKDPGTQTPRAGSI